MDYRLRRAVMTAAVMLALAVVAAGGLGLAISAVVTNVAPAGDETRRQAWQPPPSRSGESTSPTMSPSSPTGSDSPSTSPSPSASRTRGDPLRVAHARAYDPLGDGQEKDDQAALAIDGDPATVWPTEHYSTAELGGLKEGVGLLVELAQPGTVSALRVRLAGGGSSLQLRAGDRAESLSDLTVVATVDDAPKAVTIRPEQATAARYWLVWFTRLPPDDGDYRGGIAGLRLTG